MPDLDPVFAGIPLAALADAALSRARDLGAQHADLRVERIVSQSVDLRDGRVTGVADDVAVGLAVRVIVDGVWGFASHGDLTPDRAAATAERAVAVARTLAPVAVERVERADEPVHAGVEWISAYDVDPFDVPTRDKVGLLTEWSQRLLASDGVDHVHAGVAQVRENKFYADLTGTRTTQQRVRIAPAFTATAVDRGAGAFETMSSLAPPAGRGWEYLTGTGWDWDAELAEVPGLLAEKTKAPSVTAGAYDLVIDPTNLWLTIHESVGHATEYDRAIGYEAAYAGSSFATPDLLGTLRYGSEHMHVTGDRTVPHGLATVGYDDDGVATTEWDLVRDGVLVGYQLDRTFAPRLGLERSNGCAFADSPHHVPIQRMANVSLRPDPVRDTSTEELIAGVERGIYVVGDKSWSIDMQRYNFQFTGQRFYRIEDGQLAGQLRDVAYQATTTDFWGSLDAVGGPSTWVLHGAMNCGKAQPGQVAAVSHGCPSARFRGVNVLNTQEEGS
ncbi:TldD/PmbA family protein [Pseudonocardia sp. KRD-184]|uniref:TldD/PmbA family protein n=1 Tax=Pseudonocardia oceani TaxID=2792013 RepID=A0ABS6UAD8_9PSEU|nr:TldD/PmbA family protein [Pseudonocardia oceani]MBW0089735.1 TldD/PmbA family protein [Pseudonocardia oceani]MBW0095237.1 TldD/PmbA family protein [Pseudonocardia oceani]MBW0107715.1 TldD/PmbA family protein [Pseudonocardia oceani]MBW0121732.1 TldD/PmbA family protein [Pseudonocardia oceani]MBW0129197.1 TldD/PmbA family protein [Pseudonocardia oceani]